MRNSAPSAPQHDHDLALHPDSESTVHGVDGDVENDAFLSGRLVYTAVQK
jgi:hypothetical protein